MLTDKLIRAAKPAAERYALPDGAGLRLVVQPTGTKSWVLKYKVGRESKSLGLGHYPDVSLAIARVKAAQARAGIADGNTPAGPRQAAAASQYTLADMVWAWFEANRSRWRGHFCDEVKHRLETLLLKHLGDKPAASITPKMLMDEVFKPLQARSPDRAQRLRQHLDAAFAFGLVYGGLENNPAADIKSVLDHKPANNKYPALVDIDAARNMLRDIEGRAGFPAVKLLHRFQALTAVRPGEARAARWDQFENLHSDAPIWRIPAAQMKMREEHVVPLAPQAMAVIQAARTRFGTYRYVFPAGLIKPLSEGALKGMLDRAGYCGRHTAHGWRSTFSTTMNSRDRHNRDIVEIALAHYPSDVASRYNRGTYLDDRRTLMNEWADLLLADMPAPEAIIEGPRRAPLSIAA